MTTPRDAIGLSERLRDGSDNWLMSDSAREEIATQLDALHKELAQTQAHLAIRNGDLAEAVRERDSIQERVKELESDRDLYERLCSEEFTRATRIQQERDALSARVKELEAADRYANLISIIADIREKSGLGGYPMLSELADAIGSKLADAESRATSAEQERDELRGPLLLCGELGGIGKDETPVAYLRRLIDGLIDAGRERDEAYERLKPFAEAADDIEDNVSDKADIWEAPCAMQITVGHLRAARDLVHRLAAGTEKEGK